ncbi:glutathione S-transferase A1-like isoform X1 [Cricetulus griseus]|uniref:glutathione S-transferase A1-like isoform X1 n=1 Tax=Cricetulus griseus TaxID=10029 RepID=UPI0004542D2F|nr:glutathione S-transferase A1-like isoform X1 [Cricetulus griseus]
MSGKPVLHHFNGRGRVECIRWLLAAAGVEFEEKFIECPEDLEKLRKDGKLMFEQVPMVEIDGMTLVQTRAILNYIATKYDLDGKDVKERALIDMYAEGIADLSEMMGQLVVTPPDQKEAKIALIKDRTKNRYLPAFEKWVHGHSQNLICGNRHARIDVARMQVVVFWEGFRFFWSVHMSSSESQVLFSGLQALKSRLSNLPNVKKFLQPGSQRKPPIDEKVLEKAKKIFKLS